MTLCNPTAKSFISLMENIWDKDTNNLYDDWHNANNCAGHVGAVKVANTISDGEQYNIWQFPDKTAVEVNKNGSSISEVMSGSPAAKLLP